VDQCRKLYRNKLDYIYGNNYSKRVYFATLICEIWNCGGDTARCGDQNQITDTSLGKFAIGSRHVMNILLKNIGQI
jgi:hypothetical protein